VSINSTVGNVNIGFATQSSAQPFLNILSSNGAIPGSGTNGLVLSNGLSGAQLRTYSTTSGWVLQQHFFNGSEIGGIVQNGTDGLDYRTTNTGTNLGATLLKNGVKFPSTQIASTDPNTLDDYEEGTWTPRLAKVSGALLTATYANDGLATDDTSSRTLGSYIKIGKQVTVMFDMYPSSISGYVSGDDLALSGLPFTIGKGTSQTTWNSMIFRSTTLFTGINAYAVKGWFEKGTGLFYLTWQNGAFNAPGTEDYVKGSNLASSGRVTAWGTYFVD
jgi:hypothetical protein